MAGSNDFTVDPDELAGKRVLVTGGTKSMGEAIVRRFRRSGATVATTARLAGSTSWSATSVVHQSRPAAFSLLPTMTGSTRSTPTCLPLTDTTAETSAIGKGQISQNIEVSFR
jgi:NAD(P)-dependent dehydrogenase (short-subunit alcohol dehydrogenase family)